MGLQRILGLAILVAGILLLIFGVRATDEFGQKVVKEFKGEYSSTTMWYIIGGSVLIVIGGGLTFISRRK